MKRSLRALALSAGLLLAGCAPVTITEEPPATTAGIAADAASMDTVIARIDGAALTNEELQVWYWAEVAQYRQAGLSPAPDFSLPLDVQPCPLEVNAGSWQQYFLQQALNRWHTAQALIRHSQETPLPTEEAYKGNREILDKYMSQMPAAKLLYGYQDSYSPNTLHRQWLEDLEGQLSGAAADMARSLNYGYMYFTTLTYQLEAKAAIPAGEAPVTFRHLLLLPEEGESSCIPRAAALLESWMSDRNAGESTFAQLASQYSRDSGSAKNGGLYENLQKDQLPDFLAQWCFDEARAEGDTALIPTDYGVHLLYFIRTGNGPQISQEDQAALLTRIRAEYPMDIDSGSIMLARECAAPSLSELLYPDIAHERFPEVPLYLQQDYPGTMYGEYKLTTNGCGITSLAMLASYMADDELTPPEMCARYGRYSRPTGTAGSLFEEAPPQLGFYLIKKSYDWREAREYMQEGYPVVVCQHRGYWTSGGHYLVLEALTEDGMVQVRDSNMFNYRKLLRHKEDKFPWDTLQSGGKGYWIYEKKVTSIPACTRCGDPESLEHPIVTDYLCPGCHSALTRRSIYLHALPVAGEEA